MSRRQPNPAEQRAAQNTATIKSLLKLEGNKVCADCKRNKHPRWASWNLGIFVCIRCSGIHRGMGTHISRVKSVDLDAWTDEQLQSVLQWGNARANKYWEAKLAPGHIPSEAKMENFIRTKYDSKRWAMEGGIPDPSTLDAEGDDDIPLNLVKEKHSIERSTSQKGQPSRPSGPSQIQRAPQPDLFGDDLSPAPRSGPLPKNPASKSDPAPPKQTKPADSLLGLDFLGSEAAPPGRSSSATPTAGAQSRPDLKQSILSLYASNPKPQPTQEPSHSASNSFGDMQSGQIQQTSSLGAMDDAFGNLGFSKPAQKPSAYSGLGSVSNNQYKPAQTSPPPLSGGSFFDTKYTPTPQHSRGMSSSSGFGAFDSAPAPVTNTAASSALGDLFDFSTPAQTQPPPKQTMAADPPQAASAVFNLSSARSATQPKSQPPVEAMSGWSGTDAWGSNDVWSNAKTSPTTTKVAPAQTSSGDFGGWASGGSLANQSIVPGGGGGFNTTTSVPKVSADEDFGGWSSAVTESNSTTAAVPKPATGFGGSDDLFSNVWE